MSLDRWDWCCCCRRRVCNCRQEREDCQSSCQRTCHNGRPCSRLCNCTCMERNTCIFKNSSTKYSSVVVICKKTFLYLSIFISKHVTVAESADITLYWPDLWLLDWVGLGIRSYHIALHWPDFLVYGWVGSGIRSNYIALKWPVFLFSQLNDIGHEGMRA